mmetsp:Transcript_11302/g.30531  ORF Transcript_11302/g.30531 Transcript_11302/m.30531 type:complete len:423 (-) Transcript_11302:306-1574(-)
MHTLVFPSKTARAPRSASVQAAAGPTLTDLSTVTCPCASTELAGLSRTSLVVDEMVRDPSPSPCVREASKDTPRVTQAPSLGMSRHAVVSGAHSKSPKPQPSHVAWAGVATVPGMHVGVQVCPSGTGPAPAQCGWREELRSGHGGGHGGGGVHGCFRERDERTSRTPAIHRGGHCGRAREASHSTRAVRCPGQWGQSDAGCTMCSVQSPWDSRYLAETPFTHTGTGVRSKTSLDSCQPSVLGPPSSTASSVTSTSVPTVMLANASPVGKMFTSQKPHWSQLAPPNSMSSMDALALNSAMQSCSSVKVFSRWSPNLSLSGVDLLYVFMASAGKPMVPVTASVVALHPSGTRCVVSAVPEAASGNAGRMMPPFKASSFTEKQFPTCPASSPAGRKIGNPGIALKNGSWYLAAKFPHMGFSGVHE